MYDDSWDCILNGLLGNFVVWDGVKYCGNIGVIKFIVGWSLLVLWCK